MSKPHSRAKLSGQLEGWAGARTDYPRSKTIAQLFEQIADTNGDETALVCNSRRLTYSELNRRANRLAHRLRRMGVAEETMVGVSLERSPEMIVALVGILKAGAAYVPFDAAYPRERLDFMLADTCAPVIVTQKSLASRVIGNRGVATVLMDEDTRNNSYDSDSGDAQNPPAAGGPDTLAYVMYTSGSTGRPKGVLVENRSVVRLVCNTNYCSFGPREVFLQFAPVSFDASTFEIWGALLHGSRLVLMPPQATSLDDLGRAIRAHGVTTLWLTAGLFDLFVDERIQDLRPLKQLLAGGDSLSAKHVRRVLAELPGITLINGYGPTEGTTFTCCHVMRHGDDVPNSVPIGRPISNTRVYILDEQLQPVAPGAIGELCAAGDGVARGYLNTNEVTLDKFSEDPFGDAPDAREATSHATHARMYRTGDLARWRDDGTIEFVGRRDDQVKILGHRIELGEIEAVLGQYPGVRGVCVVANSDTAGNKRLVAYYVTAFPTPENGVGPQRGIKDFVATKLPAHMRPSFYVPLTALPLDPNGKVDRAALPPPAPLAVMDTEQSTPVAAGSQLEELIAGVWKQILRSDRIGLDDNFFDLGGDSLLLVAVHSNLQKQLEIQINVTDLFAYTTVRSLAKNLAGDRTAGAASFDSEQERAQMQRSVFAAKRNVMQKSAAQRENEQEHMRISESA